MRRCIRSIALGDCRRNRQAFCFPTFEASLNRDHFGLVTHALKKFQVGDCRDLKNWQLIESLGGLRPPAQMPD